MRRLIRIGFVVLVGLAALLAVNAYVLEHETRSAAVNAPDGQLIDLDTVELQYVDHPATGPGPEGQPIVLLNCFTCSLRWWDQLVPLLNEEHRVIAIDLLGHGGSEKPGGGYEIENQSAAIGDALSRLDVTGATVVGHSLGGFVATSLAEQSSDLVDQLVLIDVPAESGDSDLPGTAGAATFPVLGEALWRVKLDSMVRSASGSAFAPGTDVEDVFGDEPDRVVDDIDAMTFKSFEQSKQAGEDFLDDGSVVSRLTPTGVPVMALVGSEDQILDADAVLGEYKAIPGLRPVLVEGAGHSPNVEQPQEVADQILPFAATVPLPPEPEAGAGNGPGESENGGSRGGGRGRGNANRGGAGDGNGNQRGAGARNGGGNDGRNQNGGRRK